MKNNFFNLMYVKNVSLALYCPRKILAAWDRYVVWFFMGHSETSYLK